MVIQQYQDPSINRWLSFGFWYQEHKAMLAKFVVGTLISVNVLFWAYTFYGVGVLVIDMRGASVRTADLVAPLSDVSALHQASAPKPLAVDSVMVLPNASAANVLSATRADFLAAVQNDNPNWIMDITYTFRYSGGETEPAQWLVLPGEQTYLAVIGAEVASMPATAELVANITWQRVRDPNMLIRPNAVRAGVFVETSGTQSQSGITDISAVITNTSQYTVIGPELLLVARRPNGTLVAAWIQRPDMIESERSIDVQRRFLHPITGALEVAVYMNIDAFNERTFKLPGSGVTPL